MAINRKLLAAGFAIFGLLAAPQSSASYVQMLEFEGNDCAGVFGRGFDECNVTVEGVEYSAVIAKFGYSEETEEIKLDELNDKIYPTISGDEFGFAINESLLDWTYNPGAGDPAIHFWVGKNANGFTLFWETPLESYASLMASLDAALSVTAGSVELAQLSHITFYNSAPSVVPVPAAVWLFGSGLVGLAALSRRRAA